MVVVVVVVVVVVCGGCGRGRCSRHRTVVVVHAVQGERHALSAAKAVSAAWSGQPIDR